MIIYDYVIISDISDYEITLVRFFTTTPVTFGVGLESLDANLLFSHPMAAVNYSVLGG